MDTKKKVDNKIRIVVLAATVAIVMAFLLAAIAAVQRRDRVNSETRRSRAADAHLCSEIGTLDRIVDTQLRGALARLQASVNKHSKVYRDQRALLLGGITAIEKHHCDP